MSHESANRLALSMRGISKRYGATTALDDVTLEVSVGERHALLGENGAGKSTLIKILAGIVDEDSGDIDTGETDQQPDVAVVHQELSLAPNLTVADNIGIGSLPSRFGFVKRRQLRNRAEEALERLGVSVAVTTRVAQLGLAERQLVEIARALQFHPPVLLLDEPTSSLNSAETERLFDALLRLADEGTAIVFVSHRLTEVYELCESATVLRDGSVVDRIQLSQTPGAEIVKMMVGRNLAEEAVQETPAKGPVLLRTEALGVAGVSDVNLKLREGEILGLAGLAGAGQTEIARALGGLQRPSDGSVILHDNPLRLRTPKDAISAGIAYVPGDRALEGLALNLSVERNATLPSLGWASHLGFVVRNRTQQLSSTIVQDFDVRPTHIDLPASGLSGGNQQKIVVGKWIATRPQIVVLDDPTRGVDVGAKEAIHETIRGCARDGMGVILVSSDIPEMVALSHSIAVFRDGRIADTLTGSHKTAERVLGIMTGQN